MIVSAGDKIRKLHFNNGLLFGDAQTVTRTQNRTLGDGRISHTAFAKFLKKSVGDFENATIFGHVLTHNHKIIMSFHALLQTLLNRIHQSQVSVTLRSAVCTLKIIGKFKWRIHIVHFLCQIRNYFLFRKCGFQAHFDLCQKLFFILIDDRIGQNAQFF